MIHPDKLHVRRGSRADYINIDYDGVEIGYLRLTSDGEVATAWAHDLKHRPLVNMVGRILARGVTRG